MKETGRKTEEEGRKKKKGEHGRDEGKKRNKCTKRRKHFPPSDY